MAETPINNPKIDALWKKIQQSAGTDIKKHLTVNYSDSILKKYSTKLQGLISKYLYSLPPHVRNTEGDDISNVARIEFFETINPNLLRSFVIPTNCFPTKLK